MRFSIVAALLWIGITGANAQASPPIDQALSAKLMKEINDNVVCGANVIDLAQKLSAAHARVKELEDKYEPKKK